VRIGINIRIFAARALTGIEVVSWAFIYEYDSITEARNSVAVAAIQYVVIMLVLISL